MQILCPRFHFVAKLKKGEEYKQVEYTFETFRLSEAYGLMHEAREQQYPDWLYYGGTSQRITSRR